MLLPCTLARYSVSGTRQVAQKSETTAIAFVKQVARKYIRGVPPSDLTSGWPGQHARSPVSQIDFVIARVVGGDDLHGRGSPFIFDTISTTPQSLESFNTSLVLST